MTCPLNEFSDHATGDMPSMDSSQFYLLNPDKSEFPKDAARQARVFSLMLSGMDTATANAIVRNEP
jgi:hypothetical protein